MNTSNHNKRGTSKRATRATRTDSTTSSRTRASSRTRTSNNSESTSANESSYLRGTPHGYVRQSRFARKGVFRALDDTFQRHPLFAPSPDTFDAASSYSNAAAMNNPSSQGCSFSEPSTAQSASVTPDATHPHSRPRTYAAPREGALRVKNSSRLSYVLLIFGILFLLFFARLVYLGVVMHNDYSNAAKDMRTTGMQVEARRGTIYDRNHNVLAISVKATTVYANPSEVVDVNYTADTISQVIGGKPSDYTPNLLQKSAKFRYIKKKIDPALALKLKAYALPGIYFLQDTVRRYPYGEIAGQVIGACNVKKSQDNKSEVLVGVSGLELMYNDVLAGTPGNYRAELGADGMPIPGGLHAQSAPVDGKDIVVSIDIDMQKALELALRNGLNELQTDAGSSILMDAKTGEIMAIASAPFFNPNDRSIVLPGATSLKPVSNLLEPGSMFKTVSAMALLETNSMRPSDTVFAPSEIHASGFTVHDAHEREAKTYSLRQIMQYSSNIGISLCIEKMGFDPFYEHILRYKLHEATGIDYPGEQVGYLQDVKKWSRVTGWNVSFGQGISLTPLQLTRFYGALLNNGYEVTPHFLLEAGGQAHDVSNQKVQVIENTAAIPDMISMLQSVVDQGTGRKAEIPGYRVAGKTSTAQIYDPEHGGYKKGLSNLGFLGFISHSSSNLVCYVGADNVPSESSVTPIFHDIMSTAIQRYSIVSR